MMSETYDALILGAGAGGVCAAARFAKAGYKTLLVERLDRVGGRAGTDDIDGFKVNVGAVLLEFGGATQETAELVGAPFPVKSIDPPITFHVGDRYIGLLKGFWGQVVGKVGSAAANLLFDLNQLLPHGSLKDDTLDADAWFANHLNIPAVRGIVNNMCKTFFGTSSTLTPARLFIKYFAGPSAFKRVGFHPDGTGGLWRDIATATVRHGGEIWLNSEVKTLTVTDGLVTSATIVRNGQPAEVTSRVVVSDLGPRATVSLVGEPHFSADYLARLGAAKGPSGIMTINFASRRQLMCVSGMLSFEKDRRLAYLVNFTDRAPEMAPEGWHLYAATGIPQPTLGTFDDRQEFARMLSDIRQEIPDFDEHARILSQNMLKGDWPAQRLLAGYDMEKATPIPNLWNVGDGVKEYATSGTTSCAEGARAVVAEARQYLAA